MNYNKLHQIVNNKVRSYSLLMWSLLTSTLLVLYEPRPVTHIQKYFIDTLLRYITVLTYIYYLVCNCVWLITVMITWLFQLIWCCAIHLRLFGLLMHMHMMRWFSEYFNYVLFSYCTFWCSQLAPCMWFHHTRCIARLWC